MMFMNCRLLILLVFFLQIGCGESTSNRSEDLDPSWNIRVDRSTMGVYAEGYVSDYFDSVRLTEGDVLRLSWAGRYWQLYRIGQPYVYAREFAIPDNSNQFEARLDRNNSNFAPFVYNVVLPDTTTATLVEEDMLLADTGTINFSWDFDASAFSLEQQSVEIKLLDCSVKLPGSDTLTVPADSNARSVSVDIQNLPKPLFAGGSSCGYGVQLVFDTSIEKPSSFEGSPSGERRPSVSLQTKSRLFEFSIENGLN